MDNKELGNWLQKIDSKVNEISERLAVVESRMDEDVAQTESKQVAFDMYKMKIEELLDRLQTKLEGRTMDMLKNMGIGVSAILGVLALLKMVGVI